MKIIEVVVNTHAKVYFATMLAARQVSKFECDKPIKRSLKTTVTACCN